MKEISKSIIQVLADDPDRFGSSSKKPTPLYSSLKRAPLYPFGVMRVGGKNQKGRGESCPIHFRQTDGD